ncbi:hypothetical protein D3C87_1392390 [compost metagenome]
MLAMGQGLLRLVHPHQLGKADDRVQRRAQFMAHAGQELGLGAVRGLDLDGLTFGGGQGGLQLTGALLGASLERGVEAPQRLRLALGPDREPQTRPAAGQGQGDHHQNELHRTSSRCLENDAHRLQLCKYAR